MRYKFGPITKTKDGFELQWKRNGQLRRAIRMPVEVIFYGDVVTAIDQCLAPDGGSWEKLYPEHRIAILQAIRKDADREWFSAVLLPTELPYETDN